MYPVTKRLPCAVCGLDSFSRNGWFLVAENRWLDRLRIFTWHPSLASHKDFQSVCGRQHLKVLIAYWLNQANLRLLSSSDDCPPNPNAACCSDDDFQLPASAALLGELSVYREGHSHAWVGSPAALESILDALTPTEIDASIYQAQASSTPTETSSFKIFQASQELPYEMSFQ